jgi:hypothetical protein
MNLKKKANKYGIIDQKRDWLNQATWFCGMILMIWEIHIYRETIINISIPLSIVVVVGLIATIISWNRLGKTYNYTGLKKVFIALFINLTGWGFIACSAFMLSNYYFSESEITTKTYKILDRSSLPGSKGYRHKRLPTFKINYEKDEKELVFGHSYYKTMDLYQTVEMKTKKGLWGYEIIVTKELKM